MNRRKFVIGMGALATGSAAAIGSGAFSVARTERDITVGTTGDASAFLALEATSEYASGTSEGQLELDFTDNSESAEGLNQDADTRFDGVFTITNQGTSDTRISFHDEEGETGYDSPAAEWYYSNDGNWAANGVNEDNPVLSPGQTIHIHVLFRLTEEDASDLPDHLGIYAGEV